MSRGICDKIARLNRTFRGDFQRQNRARKDWHSGLNGALVCRFGTIERSQDLPRWVCCPSGAVAVRRMAPRLNHEDAMRKTQGKHASKSRSKATPAKLKRPTKGRDVARKPTMRVTLSPAIVSTPGTADKKNPSNRARSHTKQARVIAMLRAPVGATVDAIAGAVGWQHHSVRGFLAGVIRKRLALNLISERGEAGRVYRVVEGKLAAALRDKVSQVA